MNATMDTAREVVQRLIQSCRQTQEGFRRAAQTVDSGELKRLFSIYSQQRTRFAEELGQHLPQGAADGPSEQDWTALEASEVLRRCLDADKRTLDLYSQAIAARRMPTRAHFLVSSQYALLQRVHERVRGIFAGGQRFQE